MVPTASILILVLNLVLGFAVPVALAWWLVRKYHAKWSTILIGAATFAVFALVLEALVHQVVLKGPHGAAIQGNLWYYALYGGLMAGLFEETGRFLAMKFLLKKEPSNVLPGVAYGIGHGGAEMILIFGFSMISLLSMAVLMKTGQMDTVLSQTPDEAQAQVRQVVSTLTDSAPGTFLYGLWERASALLLHLGLSVLVWAAVRKGGKWLWLFPAAILLHATVDAQAVILSKSAGMATVETVLFAESLAVAALAWMVARKAFR
ncbi:MAG: YhfC family intramembrane metalloprotease [Bacteroidales bacterium]|nr:YhfC family intramembrane metalloprotease [Bacteroidales bacterium]